MTCNPSGGRPATPGRNHQHVPFAKLFRLDPEQIWVTGCNRYWGWQTFFTLLYVLILSHNSGQNMESNMQHQWQTPHGQEHVCDQPLFALGHLGSNQFEQPVEKGNSAHNQATQSWPMLTWTAQPHNCNGSQHLKNTKTGRIVSALGNEHIGIQFSPCQRAFFGTSCIQGTAKRTMLCLAWCFLLMLLIPDIWGHVTNKGHASPCLGEYMNPPLNLFGNELVFRWF